jgi:predicted naringenin-chalcone synthase
MTTAHINRIATATPQHDVHHAFIDFAANFLAEGTVRKLFRRMARLSAIEHRYSFVNPTTTADSSWLDAESIYVPGNFPSTARRMQLFERFAPQLARSTLDNLNLTQEARDGITHVIVTSCTGLYAPGLDFEVVNHLGLNPSVERTMIGFMGCYAAINALKSAHHIVRSVPEAAVLVLNLELCSLHFQETHELEQVLSFLVFADGCAGSLVTAKKEGLAIDSFLALSIPKTSNLITWRVGDLGFDMHLSGEVPGEIGRALKDSGTEITRGQSISAIDWWAVHPGGRSVLDSVEKGLGLSTDALDSSRDILARYGNMSSATVMFVLQKIMEQVQTGQQGCAMSFGPGLTAETMLFHAA